jgi:hypothetical protein
VYYVTYNQNEKGKRHRLSQSQSLGQVFMLQEVIVPMCHYLLSVINAIVIYTEKIETINNLTYMDP